MTSPSPLSPSMTPSIKPWLLGLSLATAVLAVAPERAWAQATYFTPRQLLTDFFPRSARVSYRKVVLSSEDRARIAQRLGYQPRKEAYTFFVAESRGKIDGYALIDEELGQHLPITFATQLSP